MVSFVVIVASENGSGQGGSTGSAQSVLRACSFMQPTKISYIAIADRALHAWGTVSGDSRACQVRWEEISSGSVGLHLSSNYMIVASITLDHSYQRPPLLPKVPMFLSFRMLR